MATSKMTTSKTLATGPSGFDITATVGRVEFGGDGDAWTEAFRVVGEVARELPYGGSRTFSFDPSGANSKFTTVTVEFPEGPDSDGWTDKGAHESFAS